MPALSTVGGPSNTMQVVIPVMQTTPDAVQQVRQLAAYRQGLTLEPKKAQASYPLVPLFIHVDREGGDIREERGLVACSSHNPPVHPN